MGALRWIIGVAAWSTALISGEYEEALERYKAGLYAEAVHLFTLSAERSNPYAQYALGQMYESGKGVAKDPIKALRWYKQAASLYQLPPPNLADENEVPRPRMYQIDPQSDAEMGEMVNRRLEIPKDADERENVLSKIFGNFGLIPYEKTFFIPAAYTSENYDTRDPVAYPGYSDYNRNVETEFQISLKKNLTYNWLGFEEVIGFGYTQEVWWQLYAHSAPFRETNYRPELWVQFPVEYQPLNDWGLTSMKIAFRHESNGLDDPLSRSWNQLYVDTIFYYGNLIATLRVWYPDHSSDNPDITDYLGYGHVKLNYIVGKHQFDLTWRNNLHFDGDNRGSIEAEWSYPIGRSKNNFWYLRAFSGYGASLMDYDHSQNRIGFGFLFSR